MGNTFGKLFTLSTWGESHGAGGIGVVVDGCPPKLSLEQADVQRQLDRRRPGQSSLTTPRKEADAVEILSGIYEGQTTGTPIAMRIPNADQRSGDYKNIQDAFRPSHADFTYQAKYGLRDPRGGGRSSARETAARVAAGAIARKVLEAFSAGSVQLATYVERVSDIAVPESFMESPLPTESEIDAHPTRCPHAETADAMAQRITQVKNRGDSVGGTVVCRVQGLPVGLGMPVFDRLEADIAKAMLSLPATKGFEVGSGFAGTYLNGSQHNDVFQPGEAQGSIQTATNRSGGVQGGISNGQELYFRVAFKPTATILTQQETVDTAGNATTLKAKGRHDPCVLPRAVPIVEAMAALVLADHWMRFKAQCG